MSAVESCYDWPYHSLQTSDIEQMFISSDDHMEVFLLLLCLGE